MITNDLTWLIGGEAGFGIQSAGHIFALAAMRGGLWAFGNAEYPSLIRGGHNSDCIRVSAKPIGIHKEKLDLLLAMNKETLDLHLNEIVDGGAVIYDSESINSETIQFPANIRIFSVPLKRIAMEQGKGDITRNIVGIGACFGLLNYDLEIFNQIIREMFGKKTEQVVNNNLAAAKAGFDYAVENYSGQFGYQLQKIEGASQKMLITGNDAICMGAVKAGCKFVAEYPMTPSSSILSTMAANAKRYNIIVKHTEDEIAAMNMIIGAGWAGTRAMTATSGGGFSLMVEALGMSSMVEAPTVCVEVQRPGPSTGLPTRTEAGDLQFVIHASQGDFPRIVIAPDDFSSFFYKTFEAFNLAEKYQIPVLILSDKHMAESVQTVELFNDQDLKIERGKLLTQESLQELLSKGEYTSVNNGFLRYKNTEDGVSPRTIPGQAGGVHRASTDEHDESGDLTEDPANRNMMMEKRARKLENALKEIPAPKLSGPENADITFVTWGSPKEAILEVIEKLNKEGITANLLSIVYMVPFHSKEVQTILTQSKNLLGVEMNFSGQLCNYLTEKTGIKIQNRILDYSGRQLTADKIYEETMKMVKNGTIKR